MILQRIYSLFYDLYMPLTIQLSLSSDPPYTPLYTFNYAIVSSPPPLYHLFANTLFISMQLSHTVPSPTPSSLALLLKKRPDTLISHPSLYHPTLPLLLLCFIIKKCFGILVFYVSILPLFLSI